MPALQFGQRCQSAAAQSLAAEIPLYLGDFVYGGDCIIHRSSPKNDAL